MHMFLVDLLNVQMYRKGSVWICCTAPWFKIPCEVWNLPCQQHWPLFQV